ncbi:MAG: TetR/AcrR family transcriptional regulator [Gordonia sp. (in: high G+C Gram-positive bacteria)]
MTAPTEGHPDKALAVPALVPDALERRPVTARGERTRTALIAAARRIFERDGFADSRLTDITAEARCSTGSFYTYFDSKEEVLDAVLAQAHRDMLHPGLPHVEEESGDDPTAVLAAANRAYFDAYQRNAGLRLVLEQVSATIPEFREKRRARSMVFVRRNARHIQELQNRGLADRELDATAAAAALSGMVSRMAYQAFVVGETDTDIDALVFTATRLWVNAIGLRRTDGPAQAED